MYGVTYTNQDRTVFFSLLHSSPSLLETMCICGVTDMSILFYQVTSFNQVIGNWDTTNVIDMYRMFNQATSFNQDVSGWCVSNFSSTPPSFDTHASSWTLPRSVWGTCP